MSDDARRIVWHGMLLFLLGLLTGLVEAKFTNIRMGLAAHLEGVMNGTFLVALGAAWEKVRLETKMRSVAIWALLIGTYGNWLFTTLAAIFGTGALSPITAPGLNASKWQETLITAGFMSIGVAIIAASIVLLWGLRRPR